MTGFFRRVFSEKQLAEGSMLPRGYGVAYDEWFTNGDHAHVVMYPIPLNCVIGAARGALHYLRKGQRWRISYKDRQLMAQAAMIRELQSELRWRGHLLGR